MPAGDVNTYPFCGACGWEAARYNVNKDIFCDSCGADVRNYGIIRTTQGEAGTPGRWNGIAPSSIVQLGDDSVGAFPGSLWTTGQGIWLGDSSSQAYWDSTAWQVGVAP